MWARTLDGDWVVAHWHFAIGCLSGGNTRGGLGWWWCVVSRTLEMTMSLSSSFRVAGAIRAI